jgi:hypothetical protein
MFEELSEIAISEDIEVKNPNLKKYPKIVIKKSAIEKFI